MKVKCDGHSYLIAFSYWRVLRDDLTECRILCAEDPDKRNWPVVGVGQASRDSRDAPNREVGRRVALKNALADWDAIEPGASVAENRRRRTAFWGAYHARKPKVSTVTVTVCGKGVQVRYNSTDPLSKSLGELIATVIGKVPNISKVSA